MSRRRPIPRRPTPRRPVPPLASACAAAVALVLAFGLAASAWAAPVFEDDLEIGPANAPRRLLLRGSTDIDAFEPVLRAFAAAEPTIALRYEQWKTNDLDEVAEAACRGEGAQVDMVISSAVDLQVKLVNEGCARPHHSALTEALPPERNWRDELFGVTREPAVMVYNRDLVSPDEAPASRFDLLDLLRPPDSRFAGHVATYDIEESGLGYLFAFADAQQATTYGGLLEAFGRSGAVATCCSAEIIDAVARGEYLVAYNVLGSYALARAERDRRIVVAPPSDYTLILSRAAMIPRDAPWPEAAAAFLDFMLSEPGRRALASSRLMVTLGESEHADVELPLGASATLRPIALSPALLVGLDRQKRALFVAQWRAMAHPRQ